MKNTGYANFCQKEKRRLLQICPYLNNRKAATLLKERWRNLTSDEKQLFQQQKNDNKHDKGNTDRVCLFEFTDELETTAAKDEVEPNTTAADVRKNQIKHNRPCYEIVVISDDESVDSKSDYKRGKDKSSIMSTSMKEENVIPSSSNCSTLSRHKRHGSRRKRKRIASWTWKTGLRRHRPQGVEEQEDASILWQRLWTLDKEQRNSVNMREHVKTKTNHQKSNQSPPGLGTKQSLFDKYNECYKLFSPPVPYS